MNYFMCRCTIFVYISKCIKCIGTSWVLTKTHHLFYHDVLTVTVLTSMKALIDLLSSETSEIRAWLDELISICSLQEQKEFYESVFSLAQTPRSLQHLARCKLRGFLEGRVLTVVPKLDLPTFIKNYLLLEFRGYIHWVLQVVCIQ